jgi:putative SOS response-associated peptidase YedK
MKRVHDRMPVILEPEEWENWLAPGKNDAVKLLDAAIDGILELYPVSTRINNPRNNDRSCILRAGENQ